MRTEIKFDFEGLVVDKGKISRFLGYEGSELPEPFAAYLEQALTDCYSLEDIAGTYQIFDEVALDEAGKSMVVNQMEFQIGRTIGKELRGTEKSAFFVCTAGNTISSKSLKLLHGDDPALGYVYDVLGNSVVEAVGDRLQEIIKQEVSEQGMKITNRYSPGYCHWDIMEQHKIFSLLGDRPSGVELTSSFLMQPVKSISGVIGIGGDVRYRDYPCVLCNLKNCVYREW